MFKYLIYKFGQFWVTRLPLNVSYAIAVFISDLHYFLSFRDRRAVRNNLETILGPGANLPARPLRGQDREVFRNFGRYLVEFFRMATEIDKEFIKERVKTKNLHYVDEVLKKGKGAIFLTAHIGNWELGGVVLSTLGYPTVAIALPHKERPVNNLFNKQRETRGVTVVPTSVALRRCLETLRNNQTVAVVADRDFTANGEPVEFLGREALLPKGAAVLSAKTGAAIIPSFLIREKGNRFTLHLEDPIYPPAQGEEVDREMVLNIMKKYIKVIEQKILEHPDQWLMFREFWATNSRKAKEN